MNKAILLFDEFAKHNDSNPDNHYRQNKTTLKWVEITYHYDYKKHIIVRPKERYKSNLIWKHGSGKRYVNLQPIRSETTLKQN